MPSPKAIKAAENLGLDMIEYADFLKDLDQTVADLLENSKQGVLTNNAKKASEAIHSIKGSVGSLGLTNTHKTCQTLESNLKDGITAKSMEQLTEMIRIYQEELIEISQGL